jgi:hypothetical protein
VGQAAIYALARVSATGTLFVVEPETVSLSNLQRYVLTTDADVGASKCELAERALGKTKRIATVPIEAEWGVDHAQITGAEVICSAVDSEATRIAIQASLPRAAYNAWTQPDDIGWSRHEQFGEEPCLACLYWPTKQRPSDHENIARALREHELRVLGYLTEKIPVNSPLVRILELAQYPVPNEAAQWLQRSLLDDLAERLGVIPESVSMWNGRLLSELYRDGICGGALVHKQVSEVPADMAVPLAHQSVLAGIMLATQLLVAAEPELRDFRHANIEHRLDLLSGFPQMSQRPRQRTDKCICGDHDFVRRYKAKWSGG